MKLRSITLTAACVVLGGLTMAGCQSNGTSSASGSGASTQASGGASGAAVNAQGTSSGTAGAGSSSQSGNGNGSGNGSAGGSSGSTCQAGDLKISLSGSNTLSGQMVQWVQLSNSSSATCTMDGFAGVDLVGTANGKSNYSWPLERDSESYSKMTLKPGEAAYFGIKYLPWTSADSAPINVTTIELTPPNTTTTVSLPWTASVLLQDAATHPGTYLTPISVNQTNN